jgi:hypothetical protein
MVRLTTGPQFRDYKAYPRELVPPLGGELTLLQRTADLLAASRVLRRDEPEQAIVHVLNLFLEPIPKPCLSKGWCSRDAGMLET